MLCLPNAKLNWWSGSSHPGDIRMPARFCAKAFVSLNSVMLKTKLVSKLCARQLALASRMSMQAVLFLFRLQTI